VFIGCETSVTYKRTNLSSYTNNKSNGFSVRCIKD
jgi:hypothetical protein